ncbi:NAD(+) diphosphatase [Limimaricola pyoseonensis]|uniref:NAD(+) diphosphatase n=1 Tax=Limimaricola pyoseonensis TaxID=521013 RepID=A0A1G7I5A1_9RHOB|nr:NAD(+) diphosphatase [Limimaricola pyoseonensis]SDF07624.1 NAD+ diphosphatase [Limimaricola pyoseonensis]
MRLADQVTFGGGGLERSAELREDRAALDALLARPEARILPVWRGRPLCGPTGLWLLPPAHPALAKAGGARLFLGRDASGAGLWAVALPDWAEGLAGSGGEALAEEVAHPAIGGAARFVELRRRMAALDPFEAEVAATARALLNWHESHRFCARCGAASEIAQAGWRRDCPACGAHHFPRTDPVVIMLVTQGDQLLLGRSPLWPERMFSLLAGFVEPGETVEAAVRREVREETGVRCGPVRYLASQPWPFPNSLMLGCRAEVEGGARPGFVLDPVEIEAAHWVSRERLARVFAGLDDEIRAPHRGAIAATLMWNWLADRLD